jgi:hypothetical protein
VRPAPLALAALLLAALPVAAQLEIERLELEARLDPREQALYTRATFFLRNRTPRSLEVLELDFPAALASRARVNAVWDRDGELPWRADEDEGPDARPLRVGLRTPLAFGKKLVVVVGYDLDLASSASSPGDAVVTEKSARLAATGWYPLPRSAAPALPRRLRLAVRLPKDWQVAASGKLKRLQEGSALATYEVTLERVEPGAPLLRAGAPLPP